jgi:hypothetical protein
LVGAAIVAAVAAFRTLTVIRRQTDATERAALAARDTAAAMMNSERAWVVIHPVNPAPDLKAATPGADSVPEVAFGFRIWNVGKTTATNVKVFSIYVLVDNLEDLPTLPQYGTLVDIPNGTLIPASNPEDINAFWSHKRLEGRGYLFQNDIEAVITQQKFLYAYGVVTYNNGVGKESSTSFGLVYNFPLPGDWRPKGFLHAGPPAYNKIE